MRTPIAGLLATIAAITLAAAPHAPAAARTAGDDPPEPRSEGHATPERTEPRTPIVDINFRGGTLSEFVEAIQAAAHPEPFNVMIPREAADIPMPPVAMRQVSAEAAIRTAAFGRQSGTDEMITIVEVSRGITDGAPVFAVNFRRFTSGQRGQAPAQTEPPVETTVEVFSLSELIRPELIRPLPDDSAGVTIKPETILSAIESAVAISGEREAEAATIRFHEESGMLLVRGTHQQVFAIDRILRLLKGEFERRRLIAWETKEAERSRAAELSELEGELSRARRDLDRLAPVLLEAERALEEMERMHETGHVSAQQRREAEARVAEWRTQREQLLKSIERSEARQRELRGKFADAATRVYPAGAVRPDRGNGPDLLTFIRAITPEPVEVEVVIDHDGDRAFAITAPQRVHDALEQFIHPQRPVPVDGDAGAPRDGR